MKLLQNILGPLYVQVLQFEHTPSILQVIKPKKNLT
jgi:hypothetical protein